MKQRIECRITGRVQMVMFRDFTERKARALGVFGWVRNEEDGAVRVAAEGGESALKNFLAHMQRGPLFARVDNVETKWKEATGEFSDFRIVYYCG